MCNVSKCMKCGNTVLTQQPLTDLHFKVQPDFFFGLANMFIPQIAENYCCVSCGKQTRELKSMYISCLPELMVFTLQHMALEANGNLHINSGSMQLPLALDLHFLNDVEYTDVSDAK